MLIQWDHIFSGEYCCISIFAWLPRRILISLLNISSSSATAYDSGFGKDRIPFSWSRIIVFTEGQSKQPMVGRPIDMASKRDKLCPSNFDGNANIDALHNSFLAFFVMPFRKNLLWSCSSLIRLWTWLVKVGSTVISPHHSHIQSGYLSLMMAKALISNSGLFCSAIRAMLIIFLMLMVVENRSSETVLYWECTRSLF